MASVAEPTKLDRLELEIDTRLLGLWRDTADFAEFNLEAVAVFMRAAYGLGYVDALLEPMRGQLLREHGYRVPPRAAA